MQLEVPVDFIGDKPEDIHRVAGIVATALAAYLERHYAGGRQANRGSVHSSAGNP